MYSERESTVRSGMQHKSKTTALGARAEAGLKEALTRVETAMIAQR